MFGIYKVSTVNGWYWIFLYSKWPINYFFVFVITSVDSSNYRHLSFTKANNITEVLSNANKPIPGLYPVKINQG